MKLILSILVCFLLSLAAHATTALFSLVEAINETNMENVLWGFQEGPTVTVEQAQTFCKQVHESFGRLTLIDHAPIPTNLTYSISLGTRPSNPTNTITGLLQSEKRGVCTISLERPKFPGLWWFIELRGKEITQPSP